MTNWWKINQEWEKSTGKLWNWTDKHGPLTTMFGFTRGQRQVGQLGETPIPSVSEITRKTEKHDKCLNIISRIIRIIGYTKFMYLSIIKKIWASLLAIPNLLWLFPQFGCITPTSSQLCKRPRRCHAMMPAAAGRQNQICEEDDVNPIFR